MRALLERVDAPDKLRALAQHGALMAAEAGVACRNLIDGFRACLELLRGGAISEATALCAEVAARSDAALAEDAAATSELADMLPKGRA